MQSETLVVPSSSPGALLLCLPPYWDMMRFQIFHCGALYWSRVTQHIVPLAARAHG
jgi:hypothetical protein